MGNLKLKSEQNSPQDLISLDQALQRISKATDLSSLYTAFLRLNADFRSQSFIEVREQGQLFVHSAIIQLWYCQGFQQRIRQLHQYWIQQVQSITTRRFVFIKIQQWKYLLELCSFLLVFSQDRLYYIMNNLSAYSRLEQQTKYVLNKFKKGEDFDDQRQKTWLGDFNREQAERYYKVMLILLTNFIKLRTAGITRSQNTFSSIGPFADACFILFCKEYFHDNYYIEIRRRAIKVNNQMNLQNASYFLGRALDQKIPALFDIAVLFILSLILDNKTNKKIEALPAHLFKNLPTLNNNNLYDFIMTITIVGISYEKTKTGEAKRLLQCNRYYCYRLIELLLKYQLTKFSNVSAFYLENLCLNCKVDQIERAYLCELAKLALSVRDSQILHKFSQYENVKYQLVFTNKKIVLTQSQIRSHLEDLKDILCEQMKTYYHRYVSTQILFQRDTYVWKQKWLWDKAIGKMKDQQHISRLSNNA